MPISITPGPWATAPEPDETGAVRIFSLSDANIAPANAYGDIPEQRTANARAIAALPELLEVLLNLEAWGRADDAQGFAGETDYDGLERIQEAAAAALRKAGAL